MSSTAPCPGRSELSAFAVGDVTAEEQDRIGRHLEGCTACLAVLEAAGPPQDSLFARLRAPLPPELFARRDAAGASTVADPPRPGGTAPPADDPGERRAALPRAFGAYELRAELGRGGMGVVYKARQAGTDRFVAVKLIRPDYLNRLRDAERAEVRSRFLGEARAAAQLSHENVVGVFEVGEVEGCPFYSMRCIEGQSLKDVLRNGPVAGRQAAAYLEPVARAVQHAHDHQILHRDLKPGNILLDGAGRPYVTDFGLAKRLGGHDLTQTGQALGTLGYAPPEQVRDASRVGVAGDVYGLGATLYHLLTGRPPFQAASDAEVLEQIKGQEPVAPRQLNPAIGRDLETIALKCLQKEPGRRYASAAALADDLGRYLRGEPIRARPVGRFERALRWCRRRPALAITGAMAVLALMAVTAVSLVFAAEKAADATRLEKLTGDLKAESERNRKLAATANAQANELAETLYSFGKHLRDAGQLERMEQFWLRAVTVSEKIPGRTREQTANMGFTCYNLGVAALQKQRHDKVIVWQTRAIDLLAPLHRAGFQPKVVDWFLSSAHLGRGLAWRAKREYTRALPEFERAAELAFAAERPGYRLEGVALARNDVGDPEGAAAEVEAALKSAPKNGENLKAAAQVYGRCAEVVATAAKVPPARREKLREGYTRRAVELLQQARDAGAYRGAAGAKELRGDLNFLAIRADAGFEALLKEMEK